MPARPPNGFLHHLPRTLEAITKMGVLPGKSEKMVRKYLIPERMVVRWEGLRGGKDTPCRVPPLEENATWFLIDLPVHGELILKITVLGMRYLGAD
ncbi:MAG: hypothetical protein MUP98_04920 [Candidatus Aminicenantes bacterium]|nr:hypothetical protein [Candidatus Aminicenantes bacterium]